MNGGETTRGYRGRLAGRTGGDKGQVVINRAVVEGRAKPKLKYHKAAKATKPKAQKAEERKAKEDSSPADAA